MKCPEMTGDWDSDWQSTIRPKSEWLRAPAPAPATPEPATVVTADPTPPVKAPDLSAVGQQAVVAEFTTCGKCKIKVCARACAGCDRCS